MRSFRALLAAIIAGVILTACAANPGPPPLAEEQAPSPSASVPVEPPVTTRVDLALGIDPVASGFNPHLLKDDSVFTRMLAELIFPSVFEGGELNRDLVVSAEEVEPSEAEVVQTIRYEIAPEAQWSDGTPITAQDFGFLYRAMTTTPGVIDATPYRAISNVRSLDSGKTVEVDFSQRMIYWPVLFRNLLPSHSIEDFGSSLNSGVPASGWRYSFDNFDRARGIVTINRNDRFWGAKPANHDTIQFREIRSAAQAADLLRAGQVDAVDVTPTQTMQQALALLPQTDLSTYSSGRTLQLVANRNLERNQRIQLQNLLNRELIAQIALGRTNDIVVPPIEANTVFDPNGTTLQGRSVRIGVDPSDSAAAQAARAVVDLLTQQGFEAELVSTDAQRLYGQVLRAGEVDAIMTWYEAPSVNALQCGANLARFCNGVTDQEIAQTLAGDMSPEQFDQVAAMINGNEHYVTPIALDQRLRAVGPGVRTGEGGINTWIAEEQ